jgi:hypothetical protein
MKKILLTIITLFVFVAIIAHGGYGPSGYCNDPRNGRKTCKTTGCHPTLSAASWSSITSDVPGSGYIPGNTYTITATVTRASHTKFGFEISDQTLAGLTGGALANINTAVQIRDSLSNHYAGHTSTGTTGTSGFHTWQFHWVAPASGTGMVRFFGAFNVTNNNNGDLGDTIVLDSMTVTESIMGLNPINDFQSNFRIFPNPASNFLSVETNVGQSSDIEVMLVNARGANTTLLFSEKNFAGDFRNTFDLQGKYSAGIYFLKVSIGNKTSVERIVIL